MRVLSKITHELLSGNEIVMGSILLLKFCFAVVWVIPVCLNNQFGEKYYSFDYYFIWKTVLILEDSLWLLLFQF